MGAKYITVFDALVIAFLFLGLGAATGAAVAFVVHGIKALLRIFREGTITREEKMWKDRDFL